MYIYSAFKFLLTPMYSEALSRASVSGYKEIWVAASGEIRLLFCEREADNAYD